MAVHIEESDGIIYIRIQGGKVGRTVQREPDINVDLDSEGGVLGIEIIDAVETTAAQLLAVLREFHLDEKLVLAA